MASPCQSVLLSVLSLLACLPTLCQGETSAPAYEEVLVTAQKRSANMQAVPIALSVVSGELIESMGIDTLVELADYVPHLSLPQSGQLTNQRITIRGVGSVGNSAIESSVGVFVDGVYYPRPASILGNLVDIESVEVLRGPQGTLFGRNSPMGVLNIATRKPTRDDQAKLRVTYGNDQAYKLTGIASGGLNQATAGRLSFHFADRDGFAANAFDDDKIGERQDMSVRGTLAFISSETLELTLTADYSQIKHNGAFVDTLVSTQNQSFLDTSSRIIGERADNGKTFDFKVNQEHEDKVDDKQWGFAADLKIDFDEHMLRSITALRQWDDDYLSESAPRLPANILPRDTFYRSKAASQEFQLLSPLGPHFDYIAGVYLYREDYEISQNMDAGSDFCAPVIAGFVGDFAVSACEQQADISVVESEFEQRLQSLATYTQGTLHVGESLDFSVGARWTKDDKDADFEQRLNNSFAAIIRSDESSKALKVNDENMTWLVSLSYTPLEDIMLYTSVSTGFKSGGFNAEGTKAVLNERRVFDAEKSKNHEVGIKSRWLDGMLVANATVFRTDIDGFQDRSFDGLSLVTSNAGKLRQQGVEFDVRFRPLEKLRLVLGLGYLDSEFLNFPAAPALPGSDLAQNLKGESNHRSPRWQRSLTAQWRDQLRGSPMNWFLLAGFHYTSEQNVGASTNQNPQTVQDSYKTVDLGLGLESRAARWRLEIYANNAFDESYCSSMYDQPFGSGLDAIDAVANTTVIRCVPGSPRRYGLQLSVNF